MKTPSKLVCFALILVITPLAAQPVAATTFMSVEPIPNEDVVGPIVLGNILSLDYGDRERWAELLIDCDIVSGVNGVSAEDVETLVNALGYVLNQGSTAHFDPALFSGLFAGFTQVGDSMLFLQPAVSKLQFIAGMVAAAATFSGADYSPFNRGGHPKTAKAGVAFRGNDWILMPDGEGYLVNVAQDPFADLGNLDNLGELRALHLQAVEDLNDLIEMGRVGEDFSSRGFHDVGCQSSSSSESDATR